MALLKLVIYPLSWFMAAFWAGVKWQGSLFFLGIPYAFILFSRLLARVEKNDKLEIADVPGEISASLFYLGLSGLFGCLCALALYGAELAYPAAFGYPSLHTLLANRPAAGSLDRAALLLYLMYGGLFLKLLAMASPRVWSWYWEKREERGKHWLWGY
jgi:hypothetical protein